MKRTITQYLNGDCIGGAPAMTPVFEDLIGSIRDHIGFERGLTVETKSHRGKPNSKVRITITMERVK